MFRQGWFYAVVGAVAILLAAMYVLRMISAVLHEKPGPSVSESALDLRAGELAILIPLVGILLFLSAWPAAISDRVFGDAKSATAYIARQAAPGVGSGGLVGTETK